MGLGTFENLDGEMVILDGHFCVFNRMFSSYAFLKEESLLDLDFFAG